jgi:hypothetical protein
MKIHPITTLFVALVIASCSRGPDPALRVHDTKYSGIGDVPYECVLDGQTGLIWEAKSDTAGLHDWRNTYTWYDPNESQGELDYRGIEDGGECAGSACDIWHYVEAVNEAGHCGHFDWRVPMRDELYSISDLRRLDNPPTANTDYFPHAQAAEYWSINDYSFQWNAAWAWSFQFGHDRVDWKASPKHVRLVRGEAAGLPKVKDSPMDP